MKKLLAALLFLSLLAPAHAQKTKTALTTEINTNLPDNTTGAITPAILRTTIIDIVNSYLDLNGTSAFNCGVNQWVSAFSSLSIPACTQPSFSNLTGNIAISQIANGSGATTNTFLRGDNTWQTPPGTGTVTEQKNTAGAGLSTSGNCDNTGTNAGSPCQYQMALNNVVLNATPADPAGTISGVGVMMGLGSTCHLTPVFSTRINLTFSGAVGNTITGDGVSFILKYGTGAAPVNGAAATGTSVGQALTLSNTLAVVMPFSRTVNITGLLVGTAYWFDIDLAGVTGGTAVMQNIICAASEF